MGVLVGGAPAVQIDCHWAPCRLPLGTVPSLLFSDRGTCELRTVEDIAAASGHLPLGVDVPLAGRMFPHVIAVCRRCKLPNFWLPPGS